MHLIPKWLSPILALGTVFVPLASAVATLLRVEGSDAVPGFNSTELRGYLTLQMAAAQPANWRFEPAAAGDTWAPNRVEWRFKLDPYAGGEVRSFTPPDMIDFGIRCPSTDHDRGAALSEWTYHTHVREKAIIQGVPDDPDLAAAVANLTKSLLSPSGAYRSIHTAGTKGDR